VEGVMFEGKFFRTQADFQSYSYPASIMRRLDYAMSYGFISSENEAKMD
jgi:hypothetical protein